MAPEQPSLAPTCSQHLSPQTRPRTLEFEEIGALLVHIRPLCLQHLVQALALQAAAGDREVDEGDPGAEVRRELHLPEGAGRFARSHARSRRPTTRLRPVFTLEGPGPHRRVAGGQEDDERWGQVDVLVPEGDQHSAARAPHLTVQDRVQDRIVAFHVLQTHTRCGVVHTECTLAVSGASQASMSHTRSLSLKITKKFRPGRCGSVD